MSQDRTRGMTSSPMNMIIGGAGIGLLAAAAGVAYVRSRKQSASPIDNVVNRAKSAKPPLGINFKGKWALNTAIKMIEHDTSRKVLLAAMKAMAKRA